MVLTLTLTVALEPGPDLLSRRDPDPAVPMPPPAFRARADRPLWRHLVFARFEEDPDDPSR